MNKIMDINICYINNIKYTLKTWEIQLMNNECLLAISFKNKINKLNLANNNIIQLGIKKNLTFESDDIRTNEIKVDTSGEIIYTIKFKGKIKEKHFLILDKPYITYNYNYLLEINNEKIKFSNLNFIKKNNNFLIKLDKNIIEQLQINDKLKLYYDNNIIFDCNVKNCIDNQTILINDFTFNKDFNYISNVDHNIIIIDNIPLNKGIIDWGLNNNEFKINMFIGEKNINLLLNNIYNNIVQINEIIVLSNVEKNFKKSFICNNIKNNFFYVANNKLIWHLLLDIKEI